MINYRTLFVGLVLSTSRGKSPTLAAAQVDPSGHQQFADDLTSRLYTNDNECSSALGVSMAFSLVYPGCVGDAIVQVRDELRYPEEDNMQLVWEDTTQKLLSNSDGQCLMDGWGGGCDSAAPLLKISNSVWFDDGDTLAADYDVVVGSYAKQIDFEADDSPLIVNEWVKNSTNGLIDSIVPEDKPLFPPYVLIAINSIYLKARWEQQFEEGFTNLDLFYDSASRSSKVSEAHFMNMVEYFDYSHEALTGYQVIDLPFAQSQMSMIFVLPMTDDMEAVPSSKLLPILDDDLQSTRMALSVPKFKFESEYADTLKDALIDIGIVDPFEEGTGALCGLFEDKEGCEKIVIDKVIQKTVIDVNEKGVEAAAVTAVMAGITSVGPGDFDDPILMILDHPFQFFIYDKSEKLVLFEGRLGLPEVLEVEPEIALLDAKHSDSDFWSTEFGITPIDPTDGSAALDECPKDQCRDPKGMCADEVLCLADPCSIPGACGEGEVCSANYCGGCNAVCEPADDLVNCCDPDAGTGGCPDEKGSFDNCWDEGGYCCSDGGWYADPGDGSGNCQDKQLDDSEACTTSDPDNNFEPDSIACPDGQDPIPETFCGRGPNRVDCDSDEYCFIDPTDRFAVCCPGNAGGTSAPIANPENIPGQPSPGLTSDDLSKSPTTAPVAPMASEGPTNTRREGPTNTPSSPSPTSSAAAPKAATFLKLLAVATTLVALLL